MGRLLKVALIPALPAQQQLIQRHQAKHSMHSRLPAKKRKRRGAGWCAWSARRGMQAGPKSCWQLTVTA